MIAVSDIVQYFLANLVPGCQPQSNVVVTALFLVVRKKACSVQAHRLGHAHYDASLLQFAHAAVCFQVLGHNLAHPGIAGVIAKWLATTEMNVVRGRDKRCCRCWRRSAAGDVAIANKSVFADSLLLVMQGGGG